MPVGIKPLYAAGTGTAIGAFNLASDIISVGGRITSGVSELLDELSKTDPEEEAHQKQMEERQRILQRVREMEMVKRDLERYGYKSFAEAKAATEKFFEEVSA